MNRGSMYNLNLIQYLVLTAYSSTICVQYMECGGLAWPLLEMVSRVQVTLIFEDEMHRMLELIFLISNELE